jgi:arylsulfatase
LYWEHEGARAIRQGKWKLVSQHLAPWSLHDMETDRCELHDVSQEHPDEVAKLTKLWDAWAARCGVIPYDQLQKRKV